MKKLIFLFFVLLSTISFCQSYTLWYETDFEKIVGGTFYSREVNLFIEDTRQFGQFNGLFSTILDLDSISSYPGKDSALYFFPNYKINGKWYSGDTILWDRFNTADFHINDPALNLDIESVVAQTYFDSLLVWTSFPSVPSPSDTSNVEDRAAWTDFKMGMICPDSFKVKLNLRLYRY